MPKRNTDENVFVKCPYYRCESQCVIYCEGVEENSAIHLAFSTPQLRKDYQERFCKSCWKRCLVAESLNRKYDYE